jgi:uncharacterized protein YegP (UPF0339 family)
VRILINLKASNGQTILASEGYTSKAARNGIESSENFKPDERFDKKESTNGKPYFNLKASNGQIIETVKCMKAQLRDNGIESVKKSAPDATVEHA